MSIIHCTLPTMNENPQTFISYIIDLLLFYDSMWKERKKRVGWKEAKKKKMSSVVFVERLWPMGSKWFIQLHTHTHTHIHTQCPLTLTSKKTEWSYLPEGRIMHEREIMRLVRKTTSCETLIVIFSSKTLLNTMSYLDIRESLFNWGQIQLLYLTSKSWNRPITKADIHNGPPQSKTWRCLSFIVW